MSKPNYYSVIPSYVRYCKELTYFEIVLYGEITALANKLGYAYPTNQYLQDLFQVTSRTISSALANLSKQGFIDIEINKDNGNERHIYLAYPIEKNCYRGIEKNYHTITLNNQITTVSNQSARNTHPNKKMRLQAYEPDLELKAIIDKVYKKRK